MMPSVYLIRIAIALVWIYEGLWCKILGRLSSQKKIVEDIPVFRPGQAHAFLILLGFFECALGLWALSGWQAVWCALAQTVLLVGMNTCGILWARRDIHDPAGMLIKNFAFVLLMWVAAELGNPH